jgi:Conjugative transposon protein TcpC
MVRRPAVERSPQSAVQGPGYPPPGMPGEPAGKPDRAGRGWAGGRWAVWAGRALLWLVLIVIAVNGVRAIFVRETQSPAAAPSRTSAPAIHFPSDLAEAFALQFGHVYLNFDQARAGQRAQQLAAFIPRGTTDDQLGWNGVGSMQLQSEQVAGIDVQDNQHALVQVLARVNNKLMEFSVPVYASAGNMTVSGEPALVPAPAPASLPPASAPETDTAAQDALQTLLPSFFQAYGTGNSATLGRFLAKGASVSGLGGIVSFQSIQNLVVPQGGSTRHITVTVRWQLPSQPGNAATAPGGAPATLDMTYDMTVVNQNGTWNVLSIQGSTQQQSQS